MKELSYRAFLYACRKIAIRARNLPIDNVYGIPRGGLVVAVYVSHLLDKPLVLAPTRSTLIIDDIADSGKTLLGYQMQGYKTATIYYHKKSLTKPDIYIYDTKGEFIKFPWETKNTARIDYADR